MHVFMCVLIYVVHKDNGTSGSSVRDVALSVGFWTVHTHRWNQCFHRIYIDERYPAGPRAESWGPPMCSREKEEEERWEVKKAVAKTDQRGDGTELQTRAGE